MSSNQVNQLISDWKYPRTSKGFTGILAGQRPQSTVLRCVNNTRIPCTAKELASMGKTRFTATVLGMSLGWAYAPYKKASQGKKTVRDPNAKPLFEVAREGDQLRGVTLYSYKKAKSNFDREERDDSLQSQILIGQVVTFFVQPFMYEAKDSKAGPKYVFPSDMDFIPEFSVIDMRIMISNNQTEGGYGLKLQSVALHSTSLYSYLGPESLLLLPATEELAKKLAEEQQRANPFIQNNLESKNVAFFSKVPAGAFISATPVVPGYFRLVGPDGSELLPGVPCVDIAQEDLWKYTNLASADSRAPAQEQQETTLDAITLLDFASAASSLYVYIASVQNYKTGDANLSDYRGVPLIDVDQFLRDVKPDDATRTKLSFPSSFAVAGMDSLLFTLRTGPVSSNGPLPALTDFALLREDTAVTRGYLVTIGTAELPDIVRFVFNATGCLAGVGGLQRVDYAQRVHLKRKVITEEKSEDE